MILDITSAALAAVGTLGTSAVHLVSPEVAEEARGAVPPFYGDAPSAGRTERFWLGEPYTTDRQGRTVALEFWREGGQYFCRLSVVHTGAIPSV